MLAMLAILTMLAMRGALYSPIVSSTQGASLFIRIPVRCRVPPADFDLAVRGISRRWLMDPPRFESERL
jgi:hypothetical protein